MGGIQKTNILSLLIILLHIKFLQMTASYDHKIKTGISLWCCQWNWSYRTNKWMAKFTEKTFGIEKESLLVGKWTAFARYYSLKK